MHIKDEVNITKYKILVFRLNGLHEILPLSSWKTFHPTLKCNIAGNAYMKTNTY